ncbi:hypothetical protein OSB04_006696 [Centaurea solstitialis]|uniref:Reverse transcriptase domain-containing protein n=1 Tax=Centaurea solstitialis TaxID=347529 RepID=A0AA38TTZ1_9ASTR|nr:hypothetical protein OSB04_006696 [Centaurea solstitialis]
MTIPLNSQAVLDDNTIASGDASDSVTRPSVFTRLSNTVSFADVVGKRVEKGLEYFPLANKKVTTIPIPIELAREASKAYTTTIVGYFLGSRIPFPIVKRYLESAWGKHGINDVMMNANGFFFIKFNDEGGSIRAVEEGLLMIRNVPFFVCPWDPSKGLTRPSHESCPLWVKIHNIPLVLFNHEGISRIASAIGVPKRLDACTSSMCDAKWGRPGFAKVLIDVWAVGDLKRELEVILPHLHGEGADMVKLTIEYLWEPAQCPHCCVFGHKKNSCPKVVKLDNNQSKRQSMTDDQGFVRVERKQWRRKDSQPLENVVDASTSGTKEGDTDPVIVEDMPLTSSGEGTSQDHAQTEVDQEVVSDLVKEGAKLSTLLNNLNESLDTDKVTGEQPKKREDGKQKGVAVDGGWIATSPKRSIPPPIPPLAPIKGILKNTNRFSALSGQSELRKDGKVDGKRMEDKGEVRELLKINDVALCSIIETHLRGDAILDACSSVFGRWNWCSNLSLCMHGTRIIVAWDARKVDVLVIEMHAQFIHCEIRVHGMAEPLFYSFVYGDNRGVERRALWSGLRKFKVFLGNRPWVVMGDFNAMLFPHDGLGGSSRRNSDMVEFGECLMDIELFDIQYTGIQYTWCQKPSDESGIRRKLDRILANTEFTLMCRDVTARFLPRGLSDHSPGILSFLGGQRRFVAPFKFDNFLTNDPRFLEIVKEGWNMHVEGTFMFRVVEKLKALKTPLRRLRSSYHGLSELVRSLHNELEIAQISADLDPHNVMLHEDIQALRGAYVQACRNEEQAARQRAKIRWLMEGDSNTKFFHQVVKEKRHVNHIHSVINLAGVYVYNQEVPDAFVDHLRSYLGESDLSLDPCMDHYLFPNKLSIVDANHMIRPFSDDEIRKAMFSIGNDKAPGSDGYSSKFFKKAWEVVGPDIMVAIHNFFYRGRLAKSLNHTLICLLPKMPNATRVSDFRPIACCSTLYKCISKVIVGRMKSYLGVVVGNYQSAFIPGRRIADNILMAHELVIGYHKEVGQPRCAFKIDIRKAYDLVDWRFLTNILTGLGFHPVLVRWIYEMVSTTSYSVALNGESRGFFHGKRGIRQGDPLSPYLFTLIMEGFSLIFKQCIREAGDFGYHKGCEAFDLTHLCFADDLFVFTRGDVHSVEILKKALEIFASKSGLTANLDKSEVFFGNVPPETRNAIRTCLPFRLGNFPIRYLGVPLSPVRLRRADYGGLLLKIKNRITNWKAKFLSFGGRRQLINSVLHSLQLYWMAIFNFPMAVIHDINRVFRNFLWHQDFDGKGGCRVGWDSVCKPLSNGGLGFKRLDIWNKALLTRHIWDLATNRDSLWVKWVLRLAFKEINLWVVRKSTRWSWVLTKLMELRPMVRRFLRVCVGNGHSTNAWEANWLSCGPLSSFIPARAIHDIGLSLSSSVSELHERFNDQWPSVWLIRFPGLANVAFPAWNDDDDRLEWVHNDSISTFSVGLAYRSFQPDMDLVTWSDAVWFKGHIHKHAFCMWLACWKRLPTQDRLRLWKEEPPDYNCSLCHNIEDSHSHLFFGCNVASQIWLGVTLAIGWMDAPTLLTDALEVVRSKALIHRLALSASVYEIWMERNKRLFTNEKRAVVQIVQQIVSTIMIRQSWKITKKGTMLHGAS